MLIRFNSSDNEILLEGGQSQVGVGKNNEMFSIMRLLY